MKQWYALYVFLYSFEPMLTCYDLEYDENTQWNLNQNVTPLTQQNAFGNAT